MALDGAVVAIGTVGGQTTIVQAGGTDHVSAQAQLEDSVDWDTKRNPRQGETAMTECTPWHETMVEKKVTYQIEFRGHQFLIQNVSVRVNLKTGERHFAPDTVERLHQIVQAERLPSHTVETSVHEYEAAPPENRDHETEV